MRALANVALLVVTTGIGLFLAEGMLGWLGYPGEPPVRAAHPPHYVETREYLEFRYRFATNGDGLRYREIPRRSNDGGFRVLVLGDSYTEGLGVEAEERFTDRLEREFAASGHEISFINGGLSGTGPRYYARLLKYVGLGYQPDAVLVCVFANDVANTDEDPTRDPIDPPARSSTGVKGWASRWWPRIYTQLQVLKSAWEYRDDARSSDFVSDVSRRAARKGVSASRIEAWVASLPPQVVDAINGDRFGFGVLAYGLLYPEFWTDALDLDTPRSEAKWRNMTGALEAIASLSRSAGARVALAYLPVHFQYDATSHRSDNLAVRTGTLVRRAWLEGRSEVESRLARWSAERSIPFLSLTEAFRAAAAAGPPLDYPLDGHWTPAGHEVAARALARWLRDEAPFGDVATASGQRRQ